MITIYVRKYACMYACMYACQNTSDTFSITMVHVQNMFMIGHVYHKLLIYL